MLRRCGQLLTGTLGQTNTACCEPGFPKRPCGSESSGPAAVQYPFFRLNYLGGVGRA